MGLRILAVSGSPIKKGNVDAYVRHMQAEAEKAGALELAAQHHGIRLEGKGRSSCKDHAPEPWPANNDSSSR